MGSLLYTFEEEALPVLCCTLQGIGGALSERAVVHAMWFMRCFAMFCSREFWGVLAGRV